MLHIVISLLISSAWATPYPDPTQLLVMPDIQMKSLGGATQELASAERTLRLQVDWLAAGETYQLTQVMDEMSGTPARRARALKKDPYGSYRGELTVNGVTYYDALGTGKEYRKLVPSLTFRFPFPSSAGEFKLWAENPLTGVMELVLTEAVEPTRAVPVRTAAVETRLLKAATVGNPLVLAIYAEGYELSRKARFFERAQKVVSDLEKSGFPNVERFHYVAVFAESKEKLGRAIDRGETPVKRDSFLGLYFPHWNQFGRWFHVVYPTDEQQFRNALASVAYDYPLALVDDGEYWGVGNYMTHTAIPAESGSSFAFLLLHEFGHFLGLNEEYEDDGPTELEHAPGIREPWSPNITFHPQAGELKWGSHVKPGTQLPTPNSHGHSKTIGAYRGGYAGSEPAGKSHKPAKECIMRAGGEFCAVCNEALVKQLAKDAGE